MKIQESDKIIWNVKKIKETETVITIVFKMDNIGFT